MNNDNHNMQMGINSNVMGGWMVRVSFRGFVMCIQCENVNLLPHLRAWVSQIQSRFVRVEMKSLCFASRLMSHRCALNISMKIRNRILLSSVCLRMKNITEKSGGWKGSTTEMSINNYNRWIVLTCVCWFRFDCTTRPWFLGLEIDWKNVLGPMNCIEIWNLLGHVNEVGVDEKWQKQFLCISIRFLSSFICFFTTNSQFHNSPIHFGLDFV